MAKQSGKGRRSRPNMKAKSAEPVVDAEVVEEVQPKPEMVTESDVKDVADAAVDQDSKTVLKEFSEPATDPEPLVEETPAADVETPVDQAINEPVAPATAPQERPRVFFPMLLGGLIAGGIGYGLAYWQFGTQTPPEPMATVSDLGALEARVDALPPPTDIAPLTDQVVALETGLTGLTDRIDGDLAGIEGALTGISDRITVLERQPNEDGTLTDTAMAAFEADLQLLRDQMGEQQSELQAMTDQTTADLAETRAQAQEVQDNAVDAARKATARATLARIQGALETGAAYEDLLPEFEQALTDPIPEAIVATSAGAATLATLQADFPALARDALGSARSEGVAGDDVSGLGGFLRSQFDVRSVAPKDGDGADAVLSRAQAAVSAGDLDTALTEAEALPDPALAILGDWLGQARARQDALTAADTLATSLTD